MAFVTIIIPNYNHSEFLKQRIESVLKQTYQNFEVILLDDCSTDQSKDILEGYRDHPKVSRISYNSSNSGSTFLQWKKGIDLAGGDWIWIAESDDWCEPTLLQELINGVTKYPGCVISYCQSLMLENNRILWHSGSEYLEECLDGKDFIFKKMLHGNSIFNASMCIFNKIEYNKISKEYTKYKFCGDWLFWIEIAQTGSVYISGKTLNYFRKHSGDVSSLAFLQGLIYNEYFQLIDYLEKRNWLRRKEVLALLLHRLKKFVYDERVQQPYRAKILKIFADRLGNEYYIAFIWQTINLLKKGTRHFRAGRS